MWDIHVVQYIIIPGDGDIVKPGTYVDNVELYRNELLPLGHWLCNAANPLVNDRD